MQISNLLCTLKKKEKRKKNVSLISISWIPRQLFFINKRSMSAVTLQSSSKNKYSIV